MHILIVADHGWVNGGQAKVAIDSALGLVQRGHRVTFMAAVGPIDKRLARAGVETICLEQNDIDSAPSRFGFISQYMWNGKAAARLKEFAAGMDPENSVIHVHAWAKAISPSIGPVLRAARVPAIYTMHEFFMVCPTGGFYNYPKAQICHLAPMSMACISTHCDARSYPRKLLRVARQMAVSLGGLKDAFRHVIFISGMQFDAAKDYMGANIVPHRISNPVDMPDPGPKGRPGSHYLFVGRVSREKGIEHFCEGARLAGVTPVIAGDGPLLEELRSKYPQARFLGWQKPAQIAPLLREARALVFPSVWYEGQPLTVYEALAMGTPVIVSDACAGREAITHGGNGLVFKSADAASLADAILKMQDEETAQTMTQRAHADYWANPMSLERHLDSIEGLYRMAISERAEPARVSQLAMA